MAAFRFQACTSALLSCLASLCPLVRTTALTTRPCNFASNKLKQPSDYAKELTEKHRQLQADKSFVNMPYPATDKICVEEAHLVSSAPLEMPSM